jgi:hypothetical protein
MLVVGPRLRGDDGTGWADVAPRPNACFLLPFRERHPAHLPTVVISAPDWVWRKLRPGPTANSFGEVAPGRWRRGPGSRASCAHPGMQAGKGGAHLAAIRQLYE